LYHWAPGTLLTATWNPEFEPLTETVRHIEGLLSRE